MNSFFKKLFKSIVLILIFNFFASAQNAIDGDGGFVALTPNGNVDDDGWPLGEQYDGTVANADVWRTSTNYFATGGSGWIDLGNPNANEQTTIYLRNGITRTDSGPPIIQTQTGFSGDLYIETKGNVRLQTDHNSGVVINAQNARNVFINGGTYDSTRRNNNGGQYAVNLSGVDNLIKIDNASFLGPDVDQDWVNSPGGTGLQLTSPNNVILNNISTEGGLGKQRRNGTIDDTDNGTANRDFGSIGGGSGLTLSVASAANIFSTNLIATAGDAGNFFITAERIDNDTISMESIGGSGISGSSILNIMTGTISGKDGGEADVGSLDGDNFNVNWTGNGGNGISGGIGVGILTNVVVTAGDGGYLSIKIPISGSVSCSANGGSAITGNASGGNISGIFLAGHGASDFVHHAGSSTLNVNGGNSINNTGQQITIQNGTFTAGNGGSRIFISSSDDSSTTTISANGGNAVIGPINIIDGIFNGGDGGQSTLYTANNTTAESYGGDAAFVTTASGTSFNSIIEKGIFRGGNGGNISLTNGTINANAGNALSSSLLDNDGDSLFIQSLGGIISTNIGTLIINDGEFYGGNGGRAISQNGSETAFGGYGAFLLGGTNLINGGTFISGNNGLTSDKSVVQAIPSIFSSNTVYTSINGDVKINGDLHVAKSEHLALSSGKLFGNLKVWDNIDKLTISSGFEASESSLFVVGSSEFNGSEINVELNNINDGLVFKNIAIDGNSKLSFSNLPYHSPNNASINIIQSLGELEFKNGAKFSNNSSINIGLGSLYSDGNLILDENSTININSDGISSGKLYVNSGIIDLTSQNSKINLMASPSQISGNISYGIFGDNASSTLDQSKVNADFGWLLDTSINPQDINSSNELVVTYQFATNQISSIGFLNTNQNNAVLAYITNTNNFSNYNNLGSSKATDLIEFSEKNEINTADGIFKDHYQLYNLISARNTEVRSRHGFASSLYKNDRPNGVSGPSPNEHSQGWIRGYSFRGKYDSESSFSSHNLDGLGTMFGIDKYFNDILVGIAVGNSSSKYRSSSTFFSDTRIINSSLYSTIGGRKKYIDLALSYADAKTDCNDTFNTTSYDVNSSMESFYIGGGYSLVSPNGLQLTPEISFLYSSYEQDNYQRSGITSKNVDAFSTTSKLLSTGINVATEYQIDWFNLGVAMIPEFRAHWLHEINSNESDTLNYTFFNNNDTGSLSVRSRDKSLIKVGAGLNIWSWYLKNTRLEVDYDLTKSESYEEHLISCKLGVKF